MQGAQEKQCLTAKHSGLLLTQPASAVPLHDEGGPGVDAAIDSCSEPSGRSLKGAALMRARGSVSDPQFQRSCKASEKGLHPDASATIAGRCSRVEELAQTPGQVRKDRFRRVVLHRSPRAEGVPSIFRLGGRTSCEQMGHACTASHLLNVRLLGAMSDCNAV